MKTVFLGMSGGVDSSVSALLLQQQGYKVVGVYMKNWSRDLPGHHCPWARDLADAKRVAVRLGLDFRVYDFETEYKQKVVDYMLAEYQRGNTPNPDIMCNQEIKFKLFAETSFEQGADLIATGHYAKTDGKSLLRATDENKDQTYFLYRIPASTLERTLFPVGHLEKPAVKKLAEQHHLHVAGKPESMGICFVGKVSIRDFLTQYFPPHPGEIRDADTDEPLGTHEGAIFYTLGQRHGLNLGGGLPYYIVRKDMNNNIIYVSRNLNSQDLWTDKLELRDIILRSTSEQNPQNSFLQNVRQAGDQNHNSSKSERVGSPACQVRSSEDLTKCCDFDSARRSGSDKKEVLRVLPRQVLVRLRHRAPLIPATLKDNILSFVDPIRRPAPGQSAVLYQSNTCLGGGIVI